MKIPSSFERLSWFFRAVTFAVSLGMASNGLGQTPSVLIVRGKIVHTMAGKPIEDGAILIVNGKIEAIARADQLAIPEGAKVVEGEHVTPGLIDVRTSAGLAGILNYQHDQDQVEHSSPIQPELRAIDAFNCKEELLEWIRGFGITTIHTGHAPGELIAGQTMIVKLKGNTVDDGLMLDGPAVVCTLAEQARKSGRSSPGTRGKMMAMLRSEFLAAQRYQAGLDKAAKEPDAPPENRDLKLEALAAILRGEKALLVSADVEQDISNALRLADEFKFRLWLEGAAESYLLLDELANRAIPVVLHPSMVRTSGGRKNLSFTTAARLHERGVLFAIEGGFESYVPKVRVVLFEAALAAAHGLPRDAALAAITINAAKLLGIDDRVGSLEIGKDGDVAVYDGDPFEYTTHCTFTIIDGTIVSSTPH